MTETVIFDESGNTSKASHELISSAAGKLGIRPPTLRSRAARHLHNLISTVCHIPTSVFHFVNGERRNIRAENEHTLSVQRLMSEYGTMDLYGMDLCLL